MAFPSATEEYTRSSELEVKRNAPGETSVPERGTSLARHSIERLYIYILDVILESWLYVCMVYFLV